MKKLMNLKGAQTLNSVEQKSINGGGFAFCNVGCVGLSSNSGCYASGNCGCPGKCVNSTSSGCVPY